MSKQRRAWRPILLMAAFWTLLSPASAGDTPARDPRSASGLVTSKPLAPAPAAPAAPAAIAERDEVMQAVDNWIRAWNARDVEVYLSAYAKNFQPAGSESRDAWERRRRIRISNKSYIHVRAEAPEVTVQNNQATVRFTQVYLSDRLRDETGKTLRLHKINGKWQIVQERPQP